MKIKIWSVGIGTNYTRWDITGYANGKGFFLGYFLNKVQAECFKYELERLMNHVIKETIDKTTRKIYN